MLEEVADKSCGGGWSAVGQDWVDGGVDAGNAKEINSMG